MQACFKARSVARAKAKAENRKKALDMLKDEIDKKEEENKGESQERTENEDLEAAGESSQRDIIVKKDSGLSKRTSSLDKTAAQAELEKFKKRAATVDLTSRP